MADDAARAPATDADDKAIEVAEAGGESVVEVVDEAELARLKEKEEKKRKARQWECRRCGMRNDPEYRNCTKCNLDAMTATTMKIKRKKFCDDCGHLHMYENYCHVYVPAEDAFKDDAEEEAEMQALLDGKDLDELALEEDDDEDDDDDEDEDEEDEDDAIFGAAKRKTNRLGGGDGAASVATKEASLTSSKAKKSKAGTEEGSAAKPPKELPYLRPLEVRPHRARLVRRVYVRIHVDVHARTQTPPAVAKTGLLRCNCKTGVPERSRRFIQFPARYEVGDILVRTYARIRDQEALAAELKAKVLTDVPTCRRAPPLGGLLAPHPHPYPRRAGRLTHIKYTPCLVQGACA